MKKLKLFFACLLMAVLSIGQVWATEYTATYTVASASSVNASGDYPDGSSATLTGNAGLNGGMLQLTYGKNAVLTISGYEGCTITGFKMSMKSNSSKGKGSMTLVAGETTLHSVPDAAFNTSNWYGSWSTSAVDVDFTSVMTTDYTVDEDENIVITVTNHGTSNSTNSLYIGSYTITYEVSSSGGSTPSLSVSPEIIDFGTVEQGTSVANKTVAVNFANLTGSVSYSGLTSPFTASGSISNTGDNITIAANTSTIGEYSRTLTVQSTADSKSATVTVKMNVVAPFDGEVLEIKNTDFATSYTSANGDHEFGCITITSNQVGNYSSSIQFQKNTGYIYNKTALGEIAKIEITKTGNNNLVVYEGTTQNPTETSITGVANDNVTTYTFSSGKSYFRIFCNNTAASNVTPIKVYYHPASYEVTLSAGSNGSLSATVDAAAIASGDDVEMCKTVTIAATPDEGYKIKSLTVTDEDDDEVEVTSNQFVMPAKAVTVAATFEATKALSSITLSGTQRTAFWVGETFSSTGLVVTAHYDDESSAEVTPASISSPDMSTPGEKTITVTYTEGTTESNTYTINVKALPTTQETAGTVADLIDIYDKLGAQSNLYIKGTIYKINGFYSEKYISYWITDSYDSGAEPNHSNEFELYNGLDFDGADFTAATDLEVGQYVIVKGNLTKFSSTYEFATGNEIVSRPKVLKGIALSGTYPIAFTQGDEFSSEGLVVTASYNYGDPTAVTPTSITGYNMAATGNQTVTVSYTESGVTKTAEYSISVAAPSSCVILATISKGAEVNGTFSLSVSGEQCLDELPGNVISTVLTAEPAEHYHLASVEATVGTVGAIADNECTISDIDASTTITAVFAENDKVTVKFAKGTESATGDVPADVANQYAGQSVTLPANPFTYTGSPIKVFGGWKHSLTNEVKQPGSYTITAADAAEDNITFTAVWNDLSPWATVYTSNVELKGNSGTKAYAEKVKITVEEVLTEFDALRACTGSAAGSCTIKVPAGTQTLHFHAAAWNAKTSTITVTMGETELLEQVLAADAGIKNSSPYTLEGIPYEYYYSIDLSSYSLTEETTITFSAGSDKRFVLFGVNAEYPAAITLDPASKDFGEVKENANAQFEFTITPNAMSTGDLVASIIGTNAAKFSVGAISENKVTVTFAPGEVGGPYSASLKIVSDNAEVTAALSGTGITSATPEIGIDKTEVAFGNVEQNSTPAMQSVAVTLSNIDEDGVSAAITGSVFSLSTNKLTENGSIDITPVTTTPGTYSETLTLSATGATSKNVTVTMTVVDEWAYVYTSNVDIDSDTDAQVTIGETNYAAAKTSKGSSATITLPQGVTKIHMHLVAWKGEAQTVTVSGDCFDEDKEITIIANDGVSGSGTTYPLGASGVDYYCSLTPDKAVAANTEITISAAGSYRFVLFGVNQEGGILPVLKSIEIAGDLTKKSGYKVGDALNMDGLTVSAIYTLNDVDQEPVDVTSLVGWSYDPLVEGQTSVTITASLEDKEDDITINDLEAVASADPKIYVSTLNVDFGSVVKDAAAPADQTIAVTLTNVANATATLGGTNPEAFSIDPATLTASGDITISIADDVTATAGTYSATITIKDDADAAEPKVVNLAFEVTDESVRKTWNLTIASYVSEPAPTSELIQWTATYVSMKNERNGSGNTAVNNYIPTAQTSTRFYKNNELTITPNGKEITSVVFTATTTGYANALQGSEWTNATASVDDKTVTVTPIDGENAISAVVGGTCGFTAVQVNYKEITPEPPTPTPDYTRTVTVGNYGTICLPNGGNISGAKLFDLEYYDGGASTLYLLEVEGSAMEAGRPYIFLPSVATIEVFYTDDADAPAESNNGLIGWLGNENKLIAPDAGNYILYQSQYWYVNSTAYVTPNHAYIHMDDVPTEPLTPAPGAAPRRRVSMAVNGENAATGFENIESGDAPMKVMIEGALYILRGEKVYDATGRLVK